MDTYDIKQIKNNPRTNNKLASSFLISIYHTDNYSLQGVIHWLETGKKLSFRSDFELLMLIYEAVNMSDNSRDIQELFRQWNDKVKSDVM